MHTMDAQADRLIDLFHAAKARIDEERERFLSEACRGDPELKEQILSLLQAHEELGDFLRQGPTSTTPPLGSEKPGDKLGHVRRPTIALDPSHGLAVDLVGQTIGSYRLLEEIGCGGMGVVYRALQLPLNRVVAVKLILSGRFASREEVARFHTEAAAAAMLQHPSIVAVYEVGEQDGRHFFSMEYVRGRDLGAVVSERPVDPCRAARYVRAIAEGVHHAHQHGVLHRDLKPSNILIDETDKPRITDFGVAKRLDQGVAATVTGALLGTPAYMSPEQARGGGSALGPTTDVYSLGAVLYHLVTGRPPFSSNSVAGTLAQVLEQEPTPPRLLEPQVPVDLDTICLKCLEKDPAQRYASAQALSEDLSCFLNGEPVLTRLVSITDFSQTQWANPDYVQRYREEADYLLPDRQRLFQVLGSFFRHHLAGRRRLRVCDLGAGDGVLGEQLLGIDGTIELTLVDGAGEVLDNARLRLGDRAGIRYVPATFAAILRREVRLGPFDFVASSFAIHHLHPPEVAALFRRLYEELQPGGWFLNIDVILPDRTELTDWYKELWRDQILEAERRVPPSRSCRDEPEVAWSLPDNKYSPLGVQLKALRAAGFVDVDCHYRNGIFGIYTGRRR